MDAQGRGSSSPAQRDARVCQLRLAIGCALPQRLHLSGLAASELERRSNEGRERGRRERQQRRQGRSDVARGAARSERRADAQLVGAAEP